MAYDQRFAIGFIGSSGEGSAKLHRRNFGELVENVAGSGEYHWMAGNFIKYAGPLTSNDLPVDSHELIALCAPRPVFISYGAAQGPGAEGQWVDQRGSFMAAVAAGPVYRLLGKNDLGTTEFPPVETALVAGELAFRQHRGGHTTGPNWPTFLTFADRCLVLTPEVGPGRRAPEEARDPSSARLAEEVGARGWIVFCAPSEQGDWDLFRCRPDGSHVRNLTKTPELNEAAPQFSRDGRRLLYRRLPRQEPINGNRYGAQGELVIAEADAAKPTVVGKSGEYPWASWSPNGEQIACLSIEGISFVELATRRVVRTLPRRGFFQQLTWSPDGKWLSGVANSFGTGWSVARMASASGAAAPVSRVDCCTPDWFPDSQTLIFSNRPPGQSENQGNGWTQLWKADLAGRSPRLVYGEDGRHVYGGNVSPDGMYVVFTGNMREDGDPEHGGAPMGIMRLADAPIIGGESKELRRLHPAARSGPVLVLPVGWEPCWTFAEIAGGLPAQTGPARAGVSSAPATRAEKPAETPADVATLAREVRDQGWISFSAPTGQGDWDLFMMRPDGSGRTSITDTREFHEAGVRFSSDGRRILYYRIPRSDAVDNNTYGTYELVIAAADGSHPVVYGRGFSWASWGPDGTQLACLDQRGIRIVDVASRNVVRQLQRRGLFQQLVWSPDGKWFAGTANGLGPYWNVGRMDAQTGELIPVSETERYNCTPDWMPGSRQILYSRGITPENRAFAELWLASGDGQERRVLYAEKNRHIYGGCASPDGKYLLFTRSQADLGPVENSHTSMAIIRMADAQTSGEPDRAKTTRPRSAPRGPVLDLSWGWEPHWTRAELRPPASPSR
jgi:Tol biopolymer transport system component